MNKIKLGQKVWILVFKMLEDIKIKDDLPVRTYEKIVDREFISLNRKKRSSVFGVSFPDDKETYWWKFAFNMPDGLKFDCEPKMIKKLIYKTKFHNFVLNIGNIAAWQSYYYAGSPRINAFLFTRNIDMQHCLDYFNNTFRPEFILKHNATLLKDAKDILKMSQDRVTQLETEITEAKTLLGKKK